MATETIHFKDRLAEYLAEKDMTHASFAAAVESASGGFCRPSVAAVQTWLEGRIPRRGTRQAIAKAMGLSVGDVFGEVA